MKIVLAWLVDVEEVAEGLNCSRRLTLVSGFLVIRYVYFVALFIRFFIYAVYLIFVLKFFLVENLQRRISKKLIIVKLSSALNCYK